MQLPSSRLTLFCTAIVLLNCQGCEPARGDEANQPERIISDLKSADSTLRKTAAERLVERAASEQGPEFVLGEISFLAQIVENKKEDVQVRASVMRAIAISAEAKNRRIDEKLAARLIKVLLDEKEEELVRAWIAMGLPHIASPELANSAILGATKSTNAMVRVNAAQQLGQLQVEPEKLIAWAIEAIKDPTPQVRLVATVAAFHLANKDKRALAILLQGVKDRDPMVRHSTARTVGLIDLTRHSELKTTMEGLLNDPDPTIAMTATISLMRSSKETTKYVSMLVKGLESERESDRAAAVTALVIMGTDVDAAKALVPTLKKTFKDPSDRVKVQAAMCLIRLTGEKEPYVKLFNELKSSKDEEVAHWALSYWFLMREEEKLSGQKKRKEKK